MDMDKQAIDETLYGSAVLYYLSGKYIEADDSCRQVLAQQEQNLGSDHLDVARSLHLLALINGDKVKFAKAYTETQRQLDQESEHLYQRALVIREKELGSEHPDVAECLNSLGLFYMRTRTETEAEPFLTRALAIREKIGEENRDLILSLNFVAKLRINQGKPAEALPLLERALQLCERVLGSEHPYMATTLGHLGEAYNAQGDYQQAEHFYQRAIKLREQSLGKDHPSLAYLLKENYVPLLRTMHREDAAATEEARAQAILEKAEV